MSSPAAYRFTVLLLWALSAYAAVAGRGLFWDGSSFLVNILDRGRIHDFYTARANVDWVTQMPVLLLAKAGVRDLQVLTIVYSASLFALPTALYHYALARAREDGVLLGMVMAIVALVYLPTWFFIVGEYNTAYACAVVVMIVVLTGGGRRLADAALLCVLAVLCVRAYEAMVYLGPLLAAALVWSRRDSRDPHVRFLLAVAALGFVAASAVAGSTLIDYWNHPHFVEVRSKSFAFWQNLQFTIPLVGLGICAVVALAWPRWLQGRGPTIVVAIAAAILAGSPWFRRLDDHSILYPPSQYLARQAAGMLLAGLLGGLWLYVAWQRQPPALFATLRRPEVARRLVSATALLLAAAAVPEVALTNLWSDYLARMKALVDGREGAIRAADLPLLDWPDKLFVQDWSLPAMSALVSRVPGHGYVIADNDYRSNPPFDPACGTMPRLQGYGWGR